MKKTSTKSAPKSTAAPKGKAQANLPAPAKKAAKKAGKKMAAALMKKIEGKPEKKPSAKKSTGKRNAAPAAAIPPMNPALATPPDAAKLLDGNKVTTELSIFGPNLNSAQQKLGQFHVHTPTCKDCDKLRKQKATEHRGSYSSPDEIAAEFYADQIAEGAKLNDCLGDFYFAPCVIFATASPIPPVIDPAAPKPPAAQPKPSAPTPPPAAPAPAPALLASRDFPVGQLVLMDATRLANIIAAPVTIPGTIVRQAVIRAHGEGQDWTIDCERLSVAPAILAPKKKRYESKTEATSNYHNHQVSKCEKPVEKVKRICAANPGKPRKEVLALCIAAGVTPGTAATQYSIWKVK